MTPRTLCVLITFVALSLACEPHANPTPVDAGARHSVLEGDATIADASASAASSEDLTLAARDEHEAECRWLGICDAPCERFVGCLESGAGAAACESRCRANADCRALSSDGGRTTLLSCLQYNGGLGCFDRICGDRPTPSAIACPNQRRCVLGGGGYACFRRSCN